MSFAGADDTPSPRLCHVKKWDDFNGYGFNLHAEKGKAGQFIGKVDENSPAEAAGLKEGDRIVEVNGTNIGNENHQQVVQRVKAVPNETKLLVVDAKTDSYYKEKKIVVRGDMAEVIKITCPDTSSGKPTVEGDGNRNTAGSTTEESEPASGSPSKPRQCHLKIWPDFAGYGFNLHAEKGKPGQYIGKVDEGSPAEMAGLKEGDRIVEVNEKAINQDNHQQVVQKIKEYPSHTKLLVVDAAGDKYYRDNDIVVTSSMPEVVPITCPDSKPSAVNGNAQVEAEVNHDTSEEEPYQDAYEEQENYGDVSNQYAGGLQREQEPELEDDDALQDEVGDYEVVNYREEKKEETAPEPEPTTSTFTVEEKKQEPVVARSPTPPPPETPTTPVSPGPVTIAGIEFAGSVAEAKARASRKKKVDPRADTSMSMKDKYDMFQKL